jgi:hypothetical protein
MRGSLLMPTLHYRWLLSRPQVNRRVVRPFCRSGRQFAASLAGKSPAPAKSASRTGRTDQLDLDWRFKGPAAPVREPMLASGAVDAVFGFSFSVYLNLKSRGVPVNDISMILMRDHGVNAFLVGEAFMRADDPGVELARLFG